MKLTQWSPVWVDYLSPVSNTERPYLSGWPSSGAALGPSLPGEEGVAMGFSDTLPSDWFSLNFPGKCEEGPIW